MYKTPVLFLCLLWSVTALAQSDSEAHAAIAKTLNYYLEGGTNNDFATLEKAFHAEATMKFTTDEGYKEVNALAFFKERMKPGPAQDRITRINSINVAGNAASAQLEIVYPTFRFIDYMNLLRVEGEWKIVNKIFYRDVFAGN